MTEAQLDVIVRSVKREYPNDGEVMVTGHLLRLGYCVQRSKLRASIHRIDPEGTAERRSIAIRRRAYHVSGYMYISGGYMYISGGYMYIS